jgi:hypothetical protein
MSWLRKSTVHLLSLVLLVSLLGLAVSTSTNLTLSSPQKVERLLDESKLYDSFASYATEQAQKSTGDRSAEATLQKNPAIKDTASTVFSPQLLKQLTDKVLESNYAWLKGETTQPNFVIDLSGAKQDFAQSVGQYVKDRLASLPPCTPIQLAQLPDPANIDYLTLDCRPPTGHGRYYRNPTTNRL